LQTVVYLIYHTFPERNEKNKISASDSDGMKVLVAVVGACLARSAVAFTHPTNEGRSVTVSLGETKVREYADESLKALPSCF
jgi:phosphatidylserine decarboxylase